MMDQKAIATFLQECKQMLDRLSGDAPLTQAEAADEDPLDRAALPAELRTLILEAKAMAWPFVPEKWQYKQALGPQDRTNLQDIVGTGLQPLLACLKAAIQAGDCATAAAIVFLSDRFLYGLDMSGPLLQVAKALHRWRPATPIAPQVVIRQARLAVHAGKLLKAEYILSSLISNNGATGTWLYRSDSDKVLVQSVCIQIRGQILQKLGMWCEAAELIWASIVGYLTLPLPDKKGISMSLGILADIFISMSKKDYEKFRNNQQTNLGLLKHLDHHLLSAAEACKLAATFSPYTPLFVLMAMNIRGTCLLSFSSSGDCPRELRARYLREANEAFELGLLTRRCGQQAASGRQELHGFLKAAFGLATAQRRLRGDVADVRAARRLCEAAMLALYAVGTSAGSQRHAALARDVMAAVDEVAALFRVRAFCGADSDAGSYVPDAFRRGLDPPASQGRATFQQVLEAHSQHHSSVCEVLRSPCGHRRELASPGVCVTALRTETRIRAPRGPRAGSEERGADRDAGSPGLSPGLGRACGAAPGASPGGRHPSSSLSSSWSRLTGSSSSSSWEDLAPQADHDPPGSEARRSGEDGAVWARGAIAASDEGEGGRRRRLAAETRGGAAGPSGAESPHSPLASEAAAAAERESPQSSPASGAAAERESPQSSPASEAAAERESPQNRPASEAAAERESPQNRSASEAAAELESPQSQPASEAAAAAERETPQNPPAPEAAAAAEHVASRQLGSGSSAAPARPWLLEARDGPEVAAASERLGCGRQEAPGAPDALPPVEPERVTSAEGTADPHSVPRGLASPGPGEDGGFAGRQHVDPEAPTVEDERPEPGGGGIGPTTHSPGPARPSRAAGSSRSPAGSCSRSPGAGEDCATTEEGGPPADALSRSFHAGSASASASSSSSWQMSSPASPTASSGAGRSASASSSEESRREASEARTLQPRDLDQLLAGVPHSWLAQRLRDTGVFQPSRLRRAHHALLLKYSKKSELWTAQETIAYLGDYLEVKKKGRQRNAFWVYHLHQEETLGRYVGKEYKQRKGLWSHFADVERQMTAQHYVTEFNKRLYEQKIPTQIFYVPSTVLLILEGMTIKGCISVEPYILGEFVKLSNNTSVVKTEYKATEYGLAYGHFSYEFSNHKDVVVDLQGWVTGSGKGLIYLTDPQIHSLDQTEVPTNFGARGIQYFFSAQHPTCNDICRRLALSRPEEERCCQPQAPDKSKP